MGNDRRQGCDSASIDDREPRNDWSGVFLEKKVKFKLNQP